MPRVVLIHGWNVSDGGKSTVDKLASEFITEGWDVDIDGADYGFIFWRMFSIIGRWFFTKKIVKRLVPAIRDADLIVAHSNGANFANKAMEYLPSEFDNSKICVYISPALNKRTEPPKAVRGLEVIHSRKDTIVKASVFLLFSPWGSMGAYGYTGLNRKVFNRDFTLWVNGHSDYFKTLWLIRMTTSTAIAFYRRYL